MTDTRNSRPWALSIVEPDGTNHVVAVDASTDLLVGDVVGMVAQIAGMFVSLIGAHDRMVIEGTPGVAPATQPEVPHRA